MFRPYGTTNIMAHIFYRYSMPDGIFAIIFVMARVFYQYSMPDGIFAIIYCHNHLNSKLYALNSMIDTQVYHYSKL